MDDQGGVARRLWELIEARDWRKAASLLAEDVVIDWPHSGERIEGANNYIEINRNYPEGWHIEVLTVLGANGRAAIEARVPHGSLGVFFVTGFYELHDGLIQKGTEYWVDGGSEQPPAWRRRWTKPL